MWSYLLQRMLGLLPILFAIATVVFFLLHAIPGDPVDLILGEQALQVDRESLIRQLGLDQPLLSQYATFLKGLVVGDWGTSLYDRRSVLQHLSDHYGATLLLAATAMFLAIAFAIPLGVLAAVKRGSIWDSLAMLLALIGISVPNFWLGPVLMLLFAVELHLLPISGFESYGSLILPSATLGASLAAMLSRMTRSSMIEELGKDYIMAAKAKGLSPRRVIFKHAFRNALNPVVTIVGLQIGTLLAGAIIAEKIFNWPGVGTLLLNSIHRRDYPVVEGCILVISFTFVVINAFTDCMYKFVDPRVKIGGA